jgi:hypothetical protein
VAGQQFYNTSPLTFTKLLDDPNTIADSLHLYIGGFSAAAKDIIEKFDFGIQIDRLSKANVLYHVIGKFADIDLHPRGGLESGNGLSLRRADPEVLRAIQRDGRGALHAA